MTFQAELRHKKIFLYPFSDAAFTLNLAGEIEIPWQAIPANTPIVVTAPQAIQKFEYADGSILTYVGENTNPGQCTLSLAKTKSDPASQIENILKTIIPGTYTTTSGSTADKSVIITNQPGLITSDWDKCYLLRLKDIDDDTDKSLWVEGRVSVNTSLTKNFGVEVSQAQIVLDAIGGETASNGFPIVWRFGNPDAGNTIE